MKLRHGIFLVLMIAAMGLSSRALVEIAALVRGSELYSHMPLIPIVSAFFLFMDRKRIFSEGGWAWTLGGVLLVLALGIMVVGWVYTLEVNQTNRLSLAMLGFVVWTLGAFLSVYGVKAFRDAAFPLMFLAFLIPVPTFILDPFVSLLQAASADSSDLVFRLTGVPFHREGMIFALPNVTIEVAKQCSGIRSSIALVITSVVAGKLFLNRTWPKIALVLAVFPVTVFKNSLRIVTLSLLGAYVDPAFLTGHWLHRSGGIPFFVAGLVLLAPVLLGLRKIERGRQPQSLY
jgi:exosortase